MTLHELETMTGIQFNEGQPSELGATGLDLSENYKSPKVDKTGDFFNPAILHNNYSGVPEMTTDWERFIQERAVYPGNIVGALAIRLFKEGIEQEQQKRLSTGQTSINYTYWVRLLKDESPEGHSIEIGLRGSDRPKIPAIMARCAIENGLSSRDTSVEALQQLANELEAIKETDNLAENSNVTPLHVAPRYDLPIYPIAGN